MSARAALLSLLALGLFAPAAHADIFAASEGRAAGRTDLDLYVINAGTGAAVALPAGVNTPSADEFHPSISADGSRIVFERRSGNTTRIVVTDLKTGTSADLLNGFEQATNPQHSPAIAPGGGTVYTGTPFTAGSHPAVTVTDLTNFPAGPFGHSTFSVFGSPDADGATTNPVLHQSRLAFDAGPTQVVVATTDGGQRTTFTDFGAASLSHPAMGAPGGAPVVVYDQRGSTGTHQADLMFRPGVSGIGDPIPLAQLNSKAFDETRPSFSADGRYLAFVARGADGIARLIVWDSQTQTNLNGAGFAMGSLDAFDIGATTIFTKDVLKLALIKPSGLVQFRVRQNTGIGILVQRVIGHHKLFGKSVPTLKMVGRVPLGRFHRGAGHVKWNGRVNGKRLPHGRYQITVRAVTSHGGIRDLGTPRVLRVG